MNFLGIFDVIGPNMIGPSSSHTAGAVSIGLTARKMFPEPIEKVRFTLYGSFARTYRGHGTDRALLGGILGFSTDDGRIRDAFLFAENMQLSYEFHIDTETIPEHPNTADIDLTGKNGHHLFVRGVSVGGGKIRILRINNVDVDFTGEYSTMIVQQLDKPGVVAHISNCLSHHNVNIAFMRLFREEKGAKAYTVVESDEAIPSSLISEIQSHSHIQEVMLISTD